ncbi:MAG: thioredoxin [Flavipsychrobacter sp.]
MAATYTDANFKAEVLDSDKLTVVDFWAQWCGPCLAMGPSVEALATEYAGQVNIGKLNADENPEVCIEYGVTGLPCVLFFKGGKLVDKQVGLASRSALEKKIKQNM